MVYTNSVRWSLKLAMLTEGARSLGLIVCFDSIVVEECRTYGKSPLGVVLLFDHPGDKIFETLINGFWLSYRNMVYAKISVLLLLSQFFEFDHFIIVNAERWLIRGLFGLKDEAV